MHPVLFQLKIPASWTAYFGPNSAIFSRWQLLLVAFVIGAGMAMWASDPKQPKERQWMVWLGLVIAIAAGIPLAGVGLVRLGEIKLHSYGVLISMGFLAGIAMAVREGQRAGMDPEKILDFSFWVLVAAIVGSRLLYIITTYKTYLKQPEKLFRIWEGGLVFYGGLLACMLVAIWFVRKHNMSFWKLSDAVIPSVALGQSFGRMGCFAAGCCYGKQVTLESVPWAVKFSSGLATKGAYLHPTQLYESFGTLVIFFALVAIRSRKRYDGQVLVWYLLLYPIERFTVELLRGDKIRGYLFNLNLTDLIPGNELLTTSQIVSFALFLIGVSSMAWLNYRDRKAHPA